MPDKSVTDIKQFMGQDDITRAVQDRMGLQPLVEKYRRIARSDKTPEKLAIIRQILLLPSDEVPQEKRQQWEQTLVKLEGDWRKQLWERAEQDIRNGDLQDLRTVQATMLGEPWRTPFAENVLQKIKDVLDEDRRRRDQQLCGRLINDAYEMMESGGKLNEITAILGRIHDVMSADEALEIAPELLERLSQVEERWEKAKKQEEEDILFNELFNELEQKMSSDAPLEEVETIYYGMQRLRREIPEITMRKVETYRVNKLAAARRKKLVINICIMVALILLAAAGIAVFRTVTRSNTIREYSARLRTSIDDTGKLSDEGFEILKEIETKVPDIRDEASIAALAEELSNKRKAEAERRVKFSKLQLTISSQLDDYAAHTASVMNAMQEIQKEALPEHQKALAALTERYEEQRSKYIRMQDTAYRRLCNEASDAFVTMKTHLARLNQDEAKKSFSVVQAKLNEAAAIADVSFDVKSSLAPLVAECTQAGDILESGLIDSGLSVRMKPLEEYVQSLQNYIREQEIELVEINYKKKDDLEKSLEQLKSDVEKGSAPLKDRFDALNKNWATIETDIAKFEELLNWEYDYFEAQQKKCYSLADVRRSLEEFQAKYPKNYMRKVHASLAEDIVRCQSKELADYDSAQHDRAARFQEALKKLGDNLKKLLYPHCEESIMTPVYIMGLVNTDIGVRVDVFMKPDISNGKNGVRFALTSPDNFTLKNVMGLDEGATSKWDFKNGILALGDYPPFTFSISFPLVKPQSMANSLANFPYKRKGQYAEWLESLVNTNFDSPQLQDFRKFDEGLTTLLGKRVDAVRTVQLFNAIADSMVSSDAAFGEGGEFELTEVIALQKELASILACLPDGYEWHSVTWKHPNEAKKFYRKLQYLDSQLVQHCFSNAMQKRLAASANDAKKLTPIGFAQIDIKSDDWSIYRFASLPDKSGDLFIADHENRKSIKIGQYTFDDSKFGWTIEYNLDRKKGYVIHVRQ